MSGRANGISLHAQKKKKYRCILQLHWVNSLPGFTWLKHTEESGKIVHAATLGSQCSVLYICLFLLLRVTCRKQEISHKHASTQNSSHYTSFIYAFHFLTQAVFVHTLFYNNKNNLIIIYKVPFKTRVTVQRCCTMQHRRKDKMKLKWTIKTVKKTKKQIEADTGNKQ